MRIGEIAIVASGHEPKLEFIKAASDEIPIESIEFIFGRIMINNQLVVHLYGLNSQRDDSVSLDVVSKKVLGYVILFNWDNEESLEQAKQIVDTLKVKKNVPVVIAANLNKNTIPIPQQLVNIDFNLSEFCDFTFYRTSDPASVKQVLVVLIDSVLEKLN